MCVVLQIILKINNARYSEVLKSFSIKIDEKY